MEDCFGERTQVLHFDEEAENKRFVNAIFESTRQLLKVDRNEFKIKHVNYMFFQYLMLYYFNILFCDFDIIYDEGKNTIYSHLTLEFDIVFEYFLLETCKKLFKNNTILIKYDRFNKISQTVESMNKKLNWQGYLFKNINNISNKVVLVDNTYKGCLYNHALLTKNVVHMEINFFDYYKNENDVLNYRKIINHPIYNEDCRISYVKGICYNIAFGGNNGYDIITPYIKSQSISGSGTLKLKLDPLFNNDFFDLRNYPNLFLLRSRFIKKNLYLNVNKSKSNEIIICNNSYDNVDFLGEDRLIQILLPQTYDTLIKFRTDFEMNNDTTVRNLKKAKFGLYCIQSYYRVIKLFFTSFDSIEFPSEDYKNNLLTTLYKSDSKMTPKMNVNMNAYNTYQVAIEKKAMDLNNFDNEVIDSFDQICRFNIIFHFYKLYEVEPFFQFKFQHHPKDKK